VNGTAAIKSAASELETRRSALASASHGSAILDQREYDERPPARQERFQLAAECCEGEEKGGGSAGAQKHQCRRADLAHGDADHQVGHAPHNTHRSEEQPAAPRHRALVPDKLGIMAICIRAGVL